MALLVALLAGCASLLSQPFTFVQMCDPQIGFVVYSNELARFEQAVAQINALQPAFVVICGDLVHHAGARSFADFKAAKARLTMPCYCAPGNHDVGDSPTFESLRRYRDEFGPDYYSFDYHGCTFVVVDTQLWKSPLSGETEAQDAWFQKTLAAAAGRGQRIFVIGHIPLFSKTADEPDGHDNLPGAKRREVLAWCEQSGVQAFLAGHSHRTAFAEVHGLQIVTSETTSVNFDFHACGFRQWHIDEGKGPYHHEFVPLEAPSARARAVKSADKAAPP